MNKLPKLYMMVQYSYVPTTGANTSQKDFGKSNQWDINETIHITDKPGKRDLEYAHTLVDVFEHKIIRSRHTEEELKDDKVLNYFLTKYQSDINQSTKTFLRKYGYDIMKYTDKLVEQSVETPVEVAV